MLLKIFKCATSFATKAASRLISALYPNLKIIFKFYLSMDPLLNTINCMQLSLMSQPRTGIFERLCTISTGIRSFPCVSSNVLLQIFIRPTDLATKVTSICVISLRPLLVSLKSGVGISQYQQNIINFTSQIFH